MDDGDRLIRNFVEFSNSLEEIFTVLEMYLTIKHCSFNGSMLKSWI